MTALEAAGSRVVGLIYPDDEVAAMIEADPEYAADVWAKGGGWTAMLPAADVPAVTDTLRRAEVQDEAEGELLFVRDE